MRAEASDALEADDSASWREQLALRLARAFSVVYLIGTLVAANLLHGERERIGMLAIGSVATLLMAVPALTGYPRGAFRAWLIVVPSVACALSAFALLGFLAGPAIVLAMTLMLAGLFLGQRVMLALAIASAATLSTIAWAMIHGHLPPPDPRSVSMTAPGPWIRSMLVFYLALGLFGSLMLAIIARMERSLERARKETRRRELAERARVDAEIGALEARQLETVGRLAAGVAHDFNNNLTAILGSAELLKYEFEGNAEAQELVAEIRRSSERAAELTRQLLVYSRKAQMLLAPTDLHRLLAEAVALFRRSSDPRVEVILALNAEPAVVPADPTLLQNAILNLLLNARDAMADGGRLTVATTNHDLPVNGKSTRSVLLEVLDTGTGIPADVLPKIFEPFFTTKPVGRGSGLGLAAVAGAIKSHGGTISVETEIGSGTAFRVVLPRAEVDAPSSVEPSAQVIRGSGEVLVVDDEPAVRNTVVATLRNLGYVVTEAPDGPTAIETVEKADDRYDLVLLDLRMPRMDGKTTFEKLRDLAPALPVLIWSGYGAEQDVNELLRQGAAGFVAKPYRLAEFSRVVAQAVRRESSRVLSA